MDRTGVAAGVVVGVVATLLVVDHLAPALRDDAPESGDLVILSGADDGRDGQRQKLIDQWNALAGKPDAEIISIAGGATAQHAAMLEYAQAGGGDVDIYNLDVTLMAEFAEFGYIRPLDADRADLDGFLPGPLATCQADDGTLWGLPFNTDAALLFYRADLIAPAEVPGSWPALRSVTARVLGDGSEHPQIVAGYAGQLADYEGLTVNALEAIWAAGGDVVDGDDEVVIESAEAKAGLATLADGLAARNPNLVLADAVEFDEAATTQAFRDGRLLFMRNWPVAYRNLAPDGDEPAGDASGAPPGALTLAQVGVAALPGPSVLGGQNLAVAAHSDQPRAAQELIEFLTSARSQQILFERGGFAATREVVYRDQVVREQYPYADTLLTAVNRARPRPETPYYARFSEVFREGVRHALAHEGQLPDGFSDRLTRALQGKT